MSIEQDEELRSLIHLDLTGGLTEDERRRLEAWSRESEENRLFLQNVRKRWNAGELRRFQEVDASQAWENIRQHTFASRPSHGLRRLRRFWQVAIVIPVAIAVSLWLVHRPEKGRETAQVIPPAVQLYPVLTLANGEQVTLNREAQDEIRVHEGVKAHNEENSLVYETQQTAGAEQFNRMEVPCGCEYRLVLADGTKVWLNAGTELKYPVAFGEQERRVYLSGEAYFEVASDSLCPFVVETGETSVKAYGTDFNVNTHSLQGMQTVLVEGSVALCRPGREELRLHPGELASVDRATSDITVRQVDPALYTAWKEGYFVFDAETLEEIMNMLARWYDKEVFFADSSCRQIRFSGHLKRYEDIDTILNAITEVTGVVFQSKGRTVTVH